MQTDELTEEDLRALGAAEDAGTETGAAEPATPEEAVESEGANEAGTSLEEAAALGEAAAVEETGNPKGVTEEAPARAALETTPEGEAEFHRAWWDTVRTEVQQTPELQNPGSPLAKAVREVLAESPLYSLAPDGFRQAAVHARARVEAAERPLLQKQLAELRAENARLTKLTSVSGSGPAQAPSEAGLSGLPLRESELQIRRMAAEFDAQLPT